MKIVKADFGKDIEKIKIEIFSDLHIGDSHCDLKSVKERIEKVKNDKYTYCILLGDLIDNATTNSVGDTYEEVLSPMEQIKQISDIFRPIKDKILFVVTGNHENRSYKTEGIDLTFFLCADLGIADKYDPISVLLFLRFGENRHHKKVCYSIYGTHGNGGGRTVGAKANALSRLKDIVNADVCIVGHTHLPIAFKEKSFVVDYQNSSVHEKETCFINTASSLKYGGYAERMSLKAGSNTNPVILLDGTKFNVSVVV